MTILADFSFNNFQILEYFNGSEKYVPTSELLYVHAHPLIRPNFLAEIEALLNETAEVMVARKMAGAVVERFTKLAVELGQQLPELTDKNAATVLGTLREIYRLCKTITGKR